MHRTNLSSMGIGHSDQSRVYSDKIAHLALNLFYSRASSAGFTGMLDRSLPFAASVSRIQQFRQIHRVARDGWPCIVRYQIPTLGTRLHSEFGPGHDAPIHDSYEQKENIHDS
jgi:hypothetical protein